MTQINVNNPVEVRNAGFAALREALGPVGMVRFIQQYDPGQGDYTKERQKKPDVSLEEAIAAIENSTGNKPTTIITDGEETCTSIQFDVYDEALLAIGSLLFSKCGTLEASNCYLNNNVTVANEIAIW